VARRDVNSSIYVKKQAHSARKTCRMNVNSEEIINFANKFAECALGIISLPKYVM
jgi:hypothetical protein